MHRAMPRFLAVRNGATLGALKLRQCLQNGSADLAGTHLWNQGLLQLPEACLELHRRPLIARRNDWPSLGLDGGDLVVLL